jgi:ABC-type antimicrobial peptide transport system permease subunit
MDHYLSDAVAPRRFSLSLMAAFALAALALAITGIYAVVTYSVSQRAREIGIRIALGASRASIARLVMGEGIRFIPVGLVSGIAMAVGLTRLLSTMPSARGGRGRLARSLWSSQRFRHSPALSRRSVGGLVVSVLKGNSSTRFVRQDPIRVRTTRNPMK